MSKTPNFDRALDKILKNLKPHKKTCQQCQGDFDILKEDIEFYKMLRVPPPKLCPDCRKQRRFGFYNNVLKFYKKTDVRTGKEIISTFSPKSAYKIFEAKYWLSDKWGAEDYAKDYDFSRPFFRQFQKLNLSVPHPSVLNCQKGVINSPYTIDVIYAKDCYFTAVAGWIENIHYSQWIVRSKDGAEFLGIIDCENCYEIINCTKCYQCFFCRESRECISSYFLYDCRNCQNCFACTNLRHKSYCFFNKQLSKEEYKEKIRKINLGNRDVLEKYKQKFEKLFKDTIKRNLNNDGRNINCLGDRLYQAKNCHYVFRGEVGLENIRYSTDITTNIKDSSDMYIVGPNVSLSCEIISVLDSSNIKFAYFISDGMDLEYCLNCRSCKYCFSCLSLHNKSYCIFNKQYSKEEYYKLLDKIKTKMLSDGEYGEFFPLSMSLHPYNDTYAMIEFPLTKKEVLKNGWQWHDEPKIPVDLKGLDLIKAKDTPKDIKDIKDDILNKAIVCEITGKPFRLIKPELDFYRKHNLPILTKHPYQRMLERFQKRNPAKLWKMKCAKCDEEMPTSYPPEKQKELKIYCKKCYIREVG